MGVIAENPPDLHKGDIISTQGDTELLVRSVQYVVCGFIMYFLREIIIIVHVSN